MSQQISVPCGIAIPQVFQDAPVDMGLVTGYVQKAEELGYHSLWCRTG
jgi:hypothetical protein